MALALAGLIEGFYGQPWGWGMRLEVCQWCSQRGMADYVYAPKDDPKHRQSWRQPYDHEELAGFERLADAGGLRLGFAISPGLSMSYDDPSDRAALAAKVDQVVGAGAGHVMLALDDIPFGGRAQGEAHAFLATWLREHLGERAGLSLVPTEYVGVQPSPYLDALAEALPADVGVAWTGMAVVNDEITAAQARARAAALGGRAPLLWDNVPVNDGLMVDRLFLGPLRGRDADLLANCSGYLSNPMVQARASTLPLASIAAWLRGEDPIAAWRREAAALGWRILAECCDGVEPAAVVADLVGGGSPEAARDFFQAAASCDAPGLEDEAGRWIEQARWEARLALHALDLLAAATAERPDHDVVVRLTVLLVGSWQRARRAEVNVMGPRCSFRPVLGQAPDGRWAVRREALQEDRNALDRLVRLALERAAQLG